MIQPKTKIAIVVPTHWSFLMGGAQMQAKLLLEELNTRPGVEVNFFASRVNFETEQPHGYTLTQVRKRSALHRYGLFWDYFSLQRRLLDFQPDLIYQRVASAYTGICARYAKISKIPMLWHVANSTDCDNNHFDLASFRRPHAYLDKLLIEYGLKNASEIIVQNKDQKTMLSKNFGKENAHLIPNFHPAPKLTVKPDPAPLEVVWIANLKESKRPEAMIEIAKHLSHLSGIRITMIGAPYNSLQQDKQDAIAKSIDKLSNLTYTGALPNEQVNSLLERSHLLVNTSIKEGFSNTFIQAWLRCVPVLTLGVNPDNRLDGGPLGESFASTRELAAEIEARQKEPEQLREDGAIARQIAIRDFSMDNAKKLADLLLSLKRNS